MILLFALFDIIYATIVTPKKLGVVYICWLGTNLIIRGYGKTV